MEKLYAPVVGGVLAVVPAFGQAAVEFGIDGSNLTRENEATQEKVLADIRLLHATCFRDVLSGTTPEGLAKLVNELKLAKQNNLKFLANVLAAQPDFDEGYQSPNAGDAFRTRCGWSQGSGN